MRSPAKILVVDDMADMLTLYQIILRDEGYEVLTAESGKKAWGIIETANISVVLSDVRMPDWSGIDLMTHAVSNHPNPPKFIMISGYPIDEADSERMKPAVAFFLKPANIPKLLLAIKSAAPA